MLRKGLKVMSIQTCALRGGILGASGLLVRGMSCMRTRGTSGPRGQSSSQVHRLGALDATRTAHTPHPGAT